MKTLFKDKKWWLETLKILIIGIIINIACIFMCSITGHCANLNSEYYPFSWGYNEIGRQEDIETIISYMTDENSQFYGYDYCFIRAVKEEHGNYYTIYYATQFFGDYYNLYGVVNQEQPYVFDVYRGTNNQGTQRYATATFAFGFNGTQRLEYVFSSANFSGCQSSLYNSIISYYSNFETLYDANGNALIYTPIDNSVGEFTDLPPLEQLLDNISNTWNNTTNSSLPNNDSNLSDSENIRNFLDTLQGNIGSSIGNLGSSIISGFNNLQRKLTDVANAILGGIHNGFLTVTQNTKDFIGAKLDKIIDLLSQLQNNANTDFDENWDNSQVKQDFDSLSQSVETSFSVWSDTSEPNEFKIPLHVENVAILNCNQTQYIDLGLFSPVLPYIRTIMWALMVYSLVYTIIDSLANYLNGGDE